MNFLTVKNPRWLNNDKTQLQAIVNFDAYGEIPFTASPNDPEPHGREIYERCVSGEFGEVALYVDPVISEEMTTIAARQKRARLLASTDWTQLPDVPAVTSEMWKPYRQALRDITIQPDYPVAITWPTVP